MLLQGNNVVETDFLRVKFSQPLVNENETSHPSLDGFFTIQVRSTCVTKNLTIHVRATRGKEGLTIQVRPSLFKKGLTIQVRST
jgi:hypothetical protein